MKTISLTSENAVIPGSRLSAAKGFSALYDSQAACLVFACGTVFKVSSLPGLVHSEMLSDTFWLYLFMIALDILCLACVFRYASSGADAALRAENNFPYRALCLLTSLYLAVKGAIYFVYTVVFLMASKGCAALRGARNCSCPSCWSSSWRTSPFWKPTWTSAGTSP